MENIIEFCNKAREDEEFMIKKAIDYSDCTGEMLHIGDFIKVTQFKLDELLLPIDTVWNTIHEKIPVYITNDLIKVFGYKGEIGKQKENILKLVKLCDIDIIKMDNQQYEEFLKCNEFAKFYPKLDKSHGKSKTLHYLIFFDDLKRLLLTVNTINGHFIKKYFISVEKLFFLYFKYQCKCAELKYENECQRIYNLLHNKIHNRLLKIERLDKILEERYRVGVVYFICEKDNESIVKIGYTFDLKKRLEELQVANCRKLIGLHYYFSSFPQKEEERLHFENKHNLVRGEWFLINDLSLIKLQI